MINIPIKIVYDILSNSETFKDYNIYLMDVDEDFSKLDTLLPIIRINEVNSYQNGFSSNLPNSMSISTQVDIWAKSIKELNNIYYEIDKVMAKEGWACYTSGIDKDTDFNDTPRIYKRYRTQQQINFA